MRYDRENRAMWRHYVVTWELSDGTEYHRLVSYRIGLSALSDKQWTKGRKLFPSMVRQHITNMEVIIRDNWRVV